MKVAICDNLKLQGQMNTVSVAGLLGQAVPILFGQQRDTRCCPDGR